MIQPEPASQNGRLASFLGISTQLILVLFLTRFTIDTGTRMIYPFIPNYAAGLGLTVVNFSWLIFIRSMAGMAGPIFGLLADRYGRRNLMTLGLLCQCFGAVGVALTSRWWAAGPMMIFGLSLAAFIPAEQAYISDRVSYDKRGRALAVVEFSWALAGILSLPLIGWLIEYFGWRTSFLAIGILSLFGVVLIRLRLPAVETRSSFGVKLATFWEVCQRPAVLAAIGGEILLFVGVGAFPTVWSIWLSQDFGFKAIGLGLVATAVGIAELGGSGLTGLYIDRIGKKRGSQIGLLATALGFGLLPFTQTYFYAVIAGLVFIGLFLEFTVVSLLPLYSDQVPEARATVFSLVGLGAAIGVAFGSPLAAQLWEQAGLWAVCGVSAGALVMGLGLVTAFVHEVEPG